MLMPLGTYSIPDITLLKTPDHAPAPAIFQETLSITSQCSISVLFDLPHVSYPVIPISPSHSEQDVSNYQPVKYSTNTVLPAPTTYVGEILPDLPITNPLLHSCQNLSWLWMMCLYYNIREPLLILAFWKMASGSRNKVLLKHVIHEPMQSVLSTKMVAVALLTDNNKLSSLSQEWSKRESFYLPLLLTLLSLLLWLRSYALAMQISGSMPCLRKYAHYSTYKLVPLPPGQKAINTHWFTRSSTDLMAPLPGTRLAWLQKDMHRKRGLILIPLLPQLP